MQTETNDTPHIDLSIEDAGKPYEQLGQIRVLDMPDSTSDQISIDLSSDISVKDDVGGEIYVKDYDPRPQEDSARRRIAYGLIALLSVVILGAMIIFMLPGTDQEALKNLLNQILGPLIALVSAGTGFYFANKK